MSRVALLAAAWGMMTGGVFSGCNGLFTPAVPEPPSGAQIILNYRSPEATMNTMAAGVAAKARGSSAWLGAFADSTRPEDGPGYHQIFDPGDLSLYQGSCQCEAPTDWRTSQEQNFYLAFLQVRPADDYAIIFEVVDSNPDQPPGDESALVHRHYTVLATAPDGNSRLVIAVGYADLTFTKIGDKWLVTRWEDHVDPAVGLNPTDPYQITLGRRRLDSTR